MITLRRANERRHVRHHRQEAWLSFYPDGQAAPLAGGFGTLEGLNEDHLPPGAGVRIHPVEKAEIITYVREGALAHDDSMGRSGVIRAGEFQRMTAGRRIRGATNASRTEWAQVFQIWLRPFQGGHDPSHELRRFCAGERRGVLCVVASPDGRRGSLRIQQDALIHSAMLDPGQHVVHELLPGRSAWLHVVKGEVTLGDFVLTAGDGVGVTTDRAVSLTAREEAEILLVDLGQQMPHSQERHVA